MGAPALGYDNAPEGESLTSMLSVFEKVLLLQDLEFFAFAHTEHLTDFAALCQMVEVGKGSVLFRRGDPCPSLYLLVRGKVTIQSDSGDAATVQSDVLDCWSFFSQSAHQHTAVSFEECTLLTISFSDLAELVTAEPEFCWALMRQLARRAVG